MRVHSFFVVLFIMTQASWFPARAQRVDTLTLHFGFNSSLIRPADTGLINRFLGRFAKTADSVIVVGYADSVGTLDYNRRLSLLRARAVARYAEELVSIRPELVALGEERLIPGGDSVNRRVQLIVRQAAGKVPNEAAGRPYGGPMPLAGRQADTTIALDNIYFVENSPVLAGESRMAIPGTIRSLGRYKGCYLEIDGFANSPGAEIGPGDPLFKLSVLRAKTIYEYFIDGGFDSSRMSYKGLGNARPVYSSPKNLQQARANMRVEIRIFATDPRGAHD